MWRLLHSDEGAADDLWVVLTEDDDALLHLFFMEDTKKRSVQITLSEWVR